MMINVSKKLVYVFFCLSILLALTGVQPAYAAGIVVNTAADEDNTGANCSLREAITAAETDAAYGGCQAGAGSDTITFAANYTITLNSQLPVVNGTIIINGNGTANTIIQANASPNTSTYRVFEVGGDLTINNLTVRHGRCNGSCATFTSEGGGIVNYGTLTVTNSIISNNSASNVGGGIFTNATLTVTNSTISNNSADSGGGIRNEAIADVTNSTIANNSATDQGGGLFNYSGTLTVTKSTISNNSASNQGGGIINFGTGTLMLANSTLSGNSTLLDGGGIYNHSAQPLTLTNSTLSGNSADSGGGINNFDGTLNLINTIIANSTAGGDCFNNSTNGIIGTNTNNLIEATGANACGLTNGVNGNIIGSDPNLDSLTGSPAYFPLKAGSPAINAGSNPHCVASPVNNEAQNGVTRPVGGTCDVGSYEFQILTSTTLVNSVLPTSRTPAVGSPVTIFNTVVNGGTSTALGVTLSMNPAPAGAFTYTQTSCATNAIIGSPNAPVDIPAGGVACYVLSFTPSSAFSATQVHIQAQASNASATSLLSGINTWLLRATASQGPDIIALTTTTDFHQVACSGAQAFAVAMSNVGTAASGDITVSANTGSASLPLSISIQETNPGNGSIIGDNILNNLGAGENRTVAVFVTFNGCVTFDPAVNRIFIEFRDASNNVVGSTSTAVSTNR